MRRRGMSPPTVVNDNEMSLAVMFDVPPQGDAYIGESDHRQLMKLKDNIRRRLHSPMTLSIRPHRVGMLNCLSIHLGGKAGTTLDLLITLAGNTVWPDDNEYARGARWYINVPDATDMMWLLKSLDVVTVNEG
ncbi:hypothetical protein CWC46_19975 [Prodigiosinella confusarubida]|uniref:Uncharacterized protein n=1 Tax=Serratia sp. (strain ATCC 39006) TaxID=104623 RepID=A0A2I5TNQ9_SERS3|nr:hypothetical protein [Serratia sp. ATCC 39006]AUH01879.1 hypothetical protein CWC46_19975 [Serratia sp. ATCC 39006]AUH06201.1 hypothetical protein Ser39006_019970 [Serratia sp. ATCC 39006]